MGQYRAQLGSPPQVSHFSGAAAMASYTMLPNGQAMVHMWQPMHLFWLKSTSNSPGVRWSAAGRANLHTSRGVALLAHHGNRNPFPLPGVNVNSRGCHPELPFMMKAASKHAVLAAGAFFGMNH